MGRGPWRWRLSGKDDADEAAWLLRLAHATCLLARHDRDHDRGKRALTELEFSDSVRDAVHAAIDRAEQHRTAA